MKKISILLFLLSSLFLSSCSSFIKTYEITYNMSLEVDKPNNTKELSVLKQKIILSDKKYFSFSDKNIEIHWVAHKKGFKFILKNKTDNTIRVLWQEAAFSDEYNISQSLLNYQNLYNDEKYPSVILAGTSIEDLVVFNYYIEHNPDSKNISSQTYFPSQIKISDNNEKYLKNNLHYLKNRFEYSNIKLLLPIQINDKVEEYIFIFKINEIGLKPVSD